MYCAYFSTEGYQNHHHHKIVCVMCIFKSSPPISFFHQALVATVLLLLFVFIDTYFEEIIPLELQQLTGHPPSFFQNITQEKDFQQVVVTDTKMFAFAWQITLLYLLQNGGVAIAKLVFDMFKCVWFCKEKDFIKKSQQNSLFQNK